MSDLAVRSQLIERSTAERTAAQWGEADVTVVARKLAIGQALGLGVAASMNSIYWDNRQNRIGIGATAFAMACRNHPEWDYRYAETTAERAEVIIYRKIDSKLTEWGRWEFTIEDARKAGLLNEKTPWGKYPKIMLAHRALSQGIRMHCPDVIAGIPAEGAESMMSEDGVQLNEAQLKGQEPLVASQEQAGASIIADFGASEPAEEIGDIP